MKVSLVIDGNYLLHKDVYTLINEKTLYGDLPVLLNNNLNNLIKLYPFDTIYFVSDSKLRWRRDYYSEYKQNRVKDDKIDWKFIFQTYDKFKEDIKEMSNINFYEIDWIEGDDIVSYIVRKNNEVGISNFIMASDGDLHQLMNFDLGLEYINIMYNFKLSDERCYLPPNYNIFIDEMRTKSNSSLFDMSEDDEFLDFLEKLINKTKITEVSPEESLFCKMVSGDRKDNVPSVYIKGKRGIGKAGSLSIYKLYKETNQEIIDFDSEIFINNLTEIISYSKKITDEEIKNEIKNNIIRNRKLLRLDENYLPTTLKEQVVNRVKIY